MGRPTGDQVIPIFENQGNTAIREARSIPFSGVLAGARGVVRESARSPERAPERRLVMSLGHYEKTTGRKYPSLVMH